MNIIKSNFKVLSFVGLLLILTGCASEENGSVFDIEPISEAKVEIDSLSLTAIDLEDVTSSYEIESGLKGDQIYVVDKYICTLNFFDGDGKLKSSHLGQGRAANETVIGQISGASFMDNGELLIFNPSGIYMIYDGNLNLDRFFNIKYTNDNVQESVYEDPLKYTHRIYKDGVLIGDVDVPKGFKVAGYAAPYYYSKVIADEDNEKLTVYKFTMPLK